MEAYTDEQITGLGNAPIVKDVRAFKERIEATFRKIGELEDIMNQLNELLIIQDMDNAAKLLGVQGQALRERLQSAAADLKKINETGTEMEGNTTEDGEEDFIDALKEEMP